MAMIKCLICKTEYNTKEYLSCPQCKYPAFSLCTQESQMKEMVRAYKKEAGFGKPLDLKVGQYFKMGRYGGEEISWRVLAVESGQALLISEKGLDAKPYIDNDNGKLEIAIWETCTLRKWLNQEFIKEAFNSRETSLLMAHKVLTDKHQNNRRAPSSDIFKDTCDRVFLLSYSEAEKYFKNKKDRRTAPTAYAKKQGALRDLTKTVAGEASCWWWLRSPGALYHAGIVTGAGKVAYDGISVGSGAFCVRPALWINLES